MSGAHAPDALRGDARHRTRAPEPGPTRAGTTLREYRRWSA